MIFETQSVRFHMMQFFCALHVTIFVSAHVRAQERSVADIIDSWNSRQTECKTIDIAWKADNYRAASVELVGEKVADVPNEFTFDSRIRFVLDGDNRGLIETDNWRWSSDASKLVPSKSKILFDGQRTLTFFPKGPVPFPDAHVGPGSLAMVIGSQQLVPVRMVYRAMDPLVGVFRASSLVRQKDEAVSSGHKIIVLKQAGSREKIVWVDPTMDYLPVRYMEYVHGFLKWQFDMSYSRSTDNSWALSAWKCNWLSPNGNVKVSENAVVESLKINAPVSDELFQVEFPDGTYVHDGFSKEKYLLRNGGQKRAVLDGELDANSITEIMGTEPGSLLRPHGAANSGLIWLNVAVIVVLTALIIYHRFYRHNLHYWR